MKSASFFKFYFAFIFLCLFFLLGVQTQSLFKCGIGQKFLNGNCVPKCYKVKCPKNTICVQGSCKPIKCNSVPCPKNSYCQNGECVPDVLLCNETPVFTVKSCTYPRPTHDKCLPPPYAPPGPGYAFCGVTASGQRLNFLPQECTVCLNQQILYYFDKPCYQAPFICKPKDRCQSSSSSSSLSNYCSSQCSIDEQCPYDWQICRKGRCVDNCLEKKCIECKYGQCGYKPNPKDECIYQGAPWQGGYCTKSGLSCVSFSCIDLCERHNCQAFEKCQYGSCVSQ